MLRPSFKPIVSWLLGILMLGGMLLSGTGCDSVKRMGVHEGGVYVIDTKDLLPLLPPEDKDKLHAPPGSITGEEKPSLGVSYLILKVYKLAPEKANIRVYTQETTLLPNSENLGDAALAAMSSMDREVSRPEFEALGKKLMWEVDGVTSGWKGPETTTPAS